MFKGDLKGRLHRMRIEGKDKNKREREREERSGKEWLEIIITIIIMIVTTLKPLLLHFKKKLL